MKIIIDCDKLIEKKDLRKIMKREKDVEKERTERKEKQGCEICFIACASFD